MTPIVLNKFLPRPYQSPIIDAIENRGYRRVLAILPRRAGKDLTAFNLCIRECIRKPCVIYYIFPTYSQAKKVIWDSITNTGERILDYVPAELVDSMNSQEMKIRFKNGSLLQLVGSDNFDCFDDITEILTEDGWKLFKNLKKKDRVATLVDGVLEFNIPKKRVIYDYDGFMYRINNSSIDMLVTPNHRFYVRSSKGFYKFKEISDPTIRHDAIPSQSGWKGRHHGGQVQFPTVGITGSCPLITMTEGDFCALVGIYLAEGSCFKNHKAYRVIISQTKSTVCEKIQQLLTRNSINFTRTKSGFNIESKVMWHYFSKFGTQEKRYIPQEIKELAPQFLKVLLDWMIMGDGYTSEVYTGYYSTSKRLIDDVQEVIIKLGLSGNVNERKQSASMINGRIIHSKRTLYEIRIRKSKFKRLSSSKKQYITQQYYKGKVYCVSTTSGVIKVRRNGKECWSGNSLMGTNPQGVVFSEYALQDPRAYQYIRPILTANNGWAVFISTPRGKNHLWELYQIAITNPAWFTLKLTVEDTKHIPLSEIDKERAEGIMSEDLIQQEYFTSFTMGVEGAYYSKYIDKMKIDGRISRVPWNSGHKVHTAWDLGVSDSTAIIFFQCIGQSINIIDCYEHNKEGLEFYIKHLESKPYQYGKHIAPHDIAVKEFGTGMTRIEKARQLGIKFIVAPNISISDGIEAVRTTFSKMNIDDIYCAKLIKSLENYRQEFDVKKKVYKSNPLHDWTSHFSDAARYMAVSLGKIREGLSAESLDQMYKEAVYGSQSNMPSVFRDDLPQY